MRSRRSACPGRLRSRYARSHNGLRSAKISPGSCRCCGWFRRLRIRWEIRDGIHEAFMTLAAAVICRRGLIH